jgi:hypothetical protein
MTTLLAATLIESFWRDGSTLLENIILPATVEHLSGEFQHW